MSDRRSLVHIVVATGLLGAALAPVQANDDVASTVHNLSVTGPGTAKATSETRVCVFCHTPHSKPGADYQAPLWNRQLSAAFYELYQSTALQGSLGQPDGASRLCLSCHDGTIALGNVNNLWAQSQTIDLTGTGPGGTMPGGSGELTGFTRHLGTSLSNDHPVSFVYDAALAAADRELRTPPTTHVGTRQPGTTQPALPLDEGGKVQCTTCHNPHLTGVDKFLRWPLTQTTATVAEGEGSILCLQCHDKAGWIGSAHQASQIAGEQYVADNYLGKSGPVWQHACLNCHDTHTVQGAKHLLKEATDSATTPKSGGNPAQEQVCFLCHAPSGESVVSVLGGRPPDIRTEFGLPYHMPLTAAEQGVSGEVHAATDVDLMESAAALGAQRHVECTDCHNPHRAGNERHAHVAPHSNTVSATSSLYGMWGVEALFTGPTAFISAEVVTANINYQLAKPATREYQICIKCHSSYAYGETPPDLKNAAGGGSYGINEVTRSTDQAKEFNPNNASFHPVMGQTGRTLATRNITGVSPFLAPFTSVGAQTMYCTDCHGAETPPISSTPIPPTPWGPHGSINPFILKGMWDINLSPPDSSLLCVRCHELEVYITGLMTDPNRTGFRGNAMGCGVMGMANLHQFHRRCLGNTYKCVQCHSAVPHGWNGSPANPLYGTANYAKMLLVERDDASPYCTSESRLLVNSWANSGSWSFSNCQTAMNGGTLRGQSWGGCGVRFTSGGSAACN